VRPVLVLDANQRSALAVTRSLGRRGVPVLTADETPVSLAGVSRYARRHLTYPSPHRDPEGFVSALTSLVEREGVAVLMPMTDVSTYLLAKHREEFGPVRIPVAPLPSYERVSDKWMLAQIAERLGIPAPSTALARCVEDLARLASEVTFPAVVKPRRSRTGRTPGWRAASVRYARSAAELAALPIAAEDITEEGVLVQEYVEGRGQGVFALYREGRALGFFAHRRLRERPPSGGVSVLSESVPVDPQQREIAQRLLDHVAWHGVAMVEFKVTPDGQPYLIEVNGRFWGSLQLAIDAGVDFPYALYQVSLGEEVEPISAYRVGVKSRWLLGDLDHLYLTLFKDEGPWPPSLGEKWRTIFEFVTSGDRATRYDVNRWGDMRPFFQELRGYLRGGGR
jgi:predicted ATP-grasp superfamily ATP-dependent carboligase